MSTTPTLATYSGACPLCHTWIAAKKSWIVRLPEAISPRESFGFSLDTGKRYYGDRRTVTSTPRRFAHWYCAPRYGTAPAFEPTGHGRPYQVAPTVPPLSGKPRAVTFGPQSGGQAPSTQTATRRDGHSHDDPSTARERKECPACIKALGLTEGAE